MTQQEIEFIHQNMENFSTARLGYVRNLGKPTLIEYENIYKKYINSSFVLTYWCSGCVLSMMKDLVKFWDAHSDMQPEQQNAIPDVQENTNLEFADRKQKTKKKKDASK